MIHLLIADDSPFVREQLRAMLSQHSELTVVGEARHGRECVDLTAQLHPDVIVMDVEMPVMDGIEATRVIMEETPTPILIHTSSFISRSRNVPFEAIRMGAVDIIQKPKLYPLDARSEKEFVSRLKMISGIKVFRRLKAKPAPSQPIAPLVNPSATLPSILGIAASTGGPKVIFDIISSLPRFIPFPIVIVQHIGASFVDGFVEWLQTTTRIQMKVAEHGEPIIANVCYVAPGNSHLRVGENHQIILDDSPPVHSCKPSADVLFSSLCDIYRNRAVGVLLTGIGEDGALGLAELRKRGATTMAQDEESCAVFGMPKRAIELNAAAFVGNASQITEQIMKSFHLR